MSLRPKAEVENLEVCPHGGANWAELEAVGLTQKEVIDFSVSSNPYPSPVSIGKILNNIPIERYPDSESTELKQCLSEKLGVVTDNIIVGSGAVELIRLVALTYFGHGDPVLILEPTFGEYKVACQITGSEVLQMWARTEDTFTPQVEEVVKIIRQRQPKGVFICNPNNPTGHYLSRQQVEMILDAIVDGLLILDESFSNFVDERWSSNDLISRGNVLMVRSMTKDYALAGLRLGYAIADKIIIDNMSRVRSPWSVNIVAQEAGVIVLSDVNYLEQCRLKIRKAKQFLVDELRRVGFTPMPSKANYFLVKVGNGERFRSALLRHGILVRDCASFGLPEYVRIAPRTMHECQKLVTAIRVLKDE